MAGSSAMFSRAAAKRGSKQWRDTAVASLQHWQNDLEKV
jgi:hypothetical protein